MFLLLPKSANCSLLDSNNASCFSSIVGSAGTGSGSGSGAT